jgi:glycosyltransferase involved in cell wall biosynthesis
MREDPAYHLGFYPSSKAHFFTRLIAGKSVFCIAASSFLKEFLFEFNQRVYYLPSGVDTDLFKPSPNGLSKEEIIFSWLGTLHKREYIENIKLGLECFSMLRKKYGHIYFDIVGDGIYRNLLLNDLKQIGDAHIRFKGWIVPEKVPEYLADIHIGIMPVARDTKFNRAKSPTKLFEYMSMSKPVVASRVGETALIINDGYNGFLAGSKEQFIDKMQELIEKEGLRRQLGERAREAVVEEYSQEILGSRLYSMLMEKDA